MIQELRGVDRGEVKKYSPLCHNPYLSVDTKVMGFHIRKMAKILSDA